MFTKNNIPRWLHTHNFYGKGAVIGADDGSFAKLLRTEWNGSKLIVIDPWDLQKEDECDIQSKTNEVHKNNFYKTLNNLETHKNKVEIIKNFSEKVCDDFEDNIFDFIYLNAHYTFENIWSDIKSWWPKIKQGGLLCGSNFGNGDSHDPKTKWKYETKSAVNKFSVDNQLDFTVGTCSTWYIIKPKKYKIALVSVYDSNYKYLYNITHNNKTEYCKKHEYDCIFYNMENKSSNKHVAYNKFLAVLDCLPFYDWVFYNDIDSLIMNQEIRLEDFIDENYDLFVTYDINSLNNGQFLVRNTPRVINFLSRSWVDNSRSGEGGWSDQISFSANLATDGKLLSRTKILDQSSFNSYIPMNMMFTDGTNAPAFKYPKPYKNGDFILHFVGMNREDRINSMTEYLKKVNHATVELRPRKEFITKVAANHKTIETQFKGAFNPAIIDLFDQYVCVYRKDEDNLIACFLDNNYKIIKNSEKLISNERAADPRLIWTPDNKLLMTYSTFEEEMSKEYMVGKIIMDKRDGVLVAGKRFRISPKSLESRQKNWIPFVHENVIYLISDINPHRIYILKEYADEAVYLAFENSWNSLWFVPNQLRGSTNPVRLPDGNFLGTFHTSQLINSTHYYDNGCYLFEAKPPFKVTLCANRAFLPAESAAEKHYRKEGLIICNFPSSMVLKENNIIISYGDNDSACKIMETNLKEMMQTLLKL